jgi:hypothetical protein
MAANFCFFTGFATFFLLPKYLGTVLGAREGQWVPSWPVMGWS